MGRHLRENPTPEEIAEAINRLNNFVDIAEDDTGNADTEFEIEHDLDKIPNRFLAVYADKGGVVYDSGGTAWTTSSIYLKCTTANTSVIIRLWAED